MLIQIKGVLDQEQLAVAHQLITAGRFTDGSSSAGMAARRVKHNDCLLYTSDAADERVRV